MKYKHVAILLGIACMGVGCKTETRAPAESAAAKPVTTYPAMGKLERLDPQFDALIPPSATIERLAEGYDWSEGPVWMRAGGYLLFSDVPKNTVYSWKEGDGAREFLKPSGYTGQRARGGEPGSNGLTVDSQGRLVLCQHGDRRVSRLELDRQYTVLAEFFETRRFNSPNDIAFKSNGDFYFTDPPYGLEKLNNDPDKELAFNGVYRVRPNGEITLLIKHLTFPNGIAFSPDERILYVAISDPNRPVIMAYDVQPDGTVDYERVFFDAKALMPGRKGLPDGLKVDVAGNVFATGPGGVLVISPTGVHLGTINTGEATANCGWGDDGSVLYITADVPLPHPDHNEGPDTIDVCVVDESLYTEDRVPPINRVLALRGVLGERAIKQIKQSMRPALRGAEPTLPEDERKILRATVDDFLALEHLKFPVYASASFGYADLPLGKAFGALFKTSNPAEGAITQCVLRAVINEWLPIAMDGVPKGHRSICLFEFPQGIPALIKRLPAVGYPTPPNVDEKVCLCSTEAWELRKSKA